MRATAADGYVGMFFSERTALRMRAGKVVAPGKGPADVLAELAVRLTHAESSMGASAAASEDLLSRFYDYVRRGVCILGSPLLTNISTGHSALGSCSAVPLSIARMSSADLELARAYYELNMGSGYNLDQSVDPCRALVQLNQHAAQVDASGACERYVGNIAHLNVDHPKVVPFATIKTTRSDLIHFNTSVNLTSDFMNALEGKKMHTFWDGTEQWALDVWQQIINAAWTCGDPGIISLERYNLENALASISPYLTTAPCAEVGLAQGESCVFGYINLAACIDATGNIDLDLVAEVSHCLTRLLDDCVQVSVTDLPTKISGAMASLKRKIGIGVCGFADALLWMGIDYGSAAATQILANSLAVINYSSKKASLELAQSRGPFPLFAQSAYFHDRSFLERFARVESVITDTEWKLLSKDVQAHGLRNVMTTALPPSGRSALFLGVNTSIEPFFSFAREDDGNLPLQALVRDGSVEFVDGDPVLILPKGSKWWSRVSSPKSLFRPAAGIDLGDHLRILKVAAASVDDGVSKTINLPRTASLSAVDTVFREAWTSGLKAISVYRDGSRQSP